jgi:predicted nucleotidyltransferase
MSGREEKPAEFSFDAMCRAVGARMREAAARAETIKENLVGASEIFRKFGITRVVLFGSHADKSPRADSDVDLLVYGLEEEQYFACMAAFEDLLGRDVDLHTDSERAGFVERAERTGIVVYEA